MATVRNFEKNSDSEKLLGDLFDGYSTNELFVPSHFSSLPEEILYSGFVTNSQYRKIVFKGKQYKSSSKAKNMRISLSAILCLILYCDMTDLCTDFSSTFRKIYPLEPIISVKKRHSKYVHFAETLRDAVNKFGNTGDDWHRQNQERGPFYSGLSSIFSLPSFAIYLKGPCSTSKSEEIAINFATRSGMIIQLQNDTGTSPQQPCFDCSWISRYSEEDERLFIAANYVHNRYIGIHRLRVQSVKIMETVQNFKQYMHAFYIFDAMISGVHVGETARLAFKTRQNKNLSIKPSDISILNALLSKDSKERANIDPYIIETFNLFLATKTEMEVDLHFVATKYAQISHLLFYSVSQYSSPDEAKCNVLNTQIFDMFPNLNQVMINTTFSCKDYVDGISNIHIYTFDLSSFLSSIESSKLSIKYIINAVLIERNRYLERLTNSVSQSWIALSAHPSIRKEYSGKQWNIFEKHHDGDGSVIGLEIFK